MPSHALGTLADPQVASWEELLRSVLDGDAALDLVAQPIVDLVSGHVSGYELLSRFGWPFTAGDLSATPSPDRWFAAAARLGLAPQLTVAVLRRALSVRQSLPPGLYCTVNVGPEVLSHPMVREALDTDLDGVVIELTEHTGADPTPELLETLSDLRGRRAVIAVDDMGAGYSGLTQLLAVSPQIVKLDRSLIAGVDADPRRRDVVKALRDLVQRLDASLVAEGIETYAECEALVRLDVPMGQGWFLGPPTVPWPEVHGEVRAWIRAVASRTSASRTVASLVRAFGDGAFVGAGPEVWAVRAADGRPGSVVWRAPGSTLFTSPAMSERDDTPVHEVLRRALDRPEPDRWAPVVIVDDTGRMLGWVDVADAVRMVTGMEAVAPKRLRAVGLPRPRRG